MVNYPARKQPALLTEISDIIFNVMYSSFTEDTGCIDMVFSISEKRGRTPLQLSGR